MQRASRYKSSNGLPDGSEMHKDGKIQPAPKPIRRLFPQQHVQDQTIMAVYMIHAATSVVLYKPGFPYLTSPTLKDSENKSEVHQQLETY